MSALIILFYFYMFWTNLSDDETIMGLLELINLNQLSEIYDAFNLMQSYFAHEK